LQQPLRESVFNAHGTGNTPNRSMLHHLLQAPNPPSVPLMLLYGARNPQWLLYGDDFRQLEEQHPNFRFWPTLSRPVNGWEGRQGYVQALLEKVL
jgi:CDP-4-dehydro-6-deoxyglucose reductase